MAKVRSPNYPNVSLTVALGYVRQIYEQDHRNKVSRAAIGAHLGHESLSGPALGKIGAMRAYGLLEGAGDEMRVSDDAITALMAPEGSEDRKAAIESLAFQPSLYREIRNDHPETAPSEQNLQWWLVQHQFTPDAAWIAAKSFRETMELVKEAGGSYSANSAEKPQESTVSAMADAVKPDQIVTQKGIRIMESERVAFTEESGPGQYLKLIASGEFDDTMLEALEDFVKRQRKRISQNVVSYSGGDAVPTTGTYRARHTGHLAFSTANCTRGQTFRPCSKCSVTYTLKEEVPESDE